MKVKRCVDLLYMYLTHHFIGLVLCFVKSVGFLLELLLSNCLIILFFSLVLVFSIKGINPKRPIHESSILSCGPLTDFYDFVYLPERIFSKIKSIKC